MFRAFCVPYYTIPRKIRELQFLGVFKQKACIIPYQEKLGNYNMACDSPATY